MKSRHLFLAAGLIFIVVAVLALWRTQNYIAAAVNAIAGAIFLFLAVTPPRRR